MWDGLKRAKTGDPRLKLERIENIAGSINPDVHGGNLLNAEFWIELKACENPPKRDSTLILEPLFRPGQIPWAQDWAKYGALCFTISSVGTDHVLLWTKDVPGLTKGMLPEFTLASGWRGIIEYLATLERR